MGHAFQHTLMDALTRLHRMEGDNTYGSPVRITRHRDANGSRAAAERRRRETAAISPRSVYRTRVAMERTVRGTISRQMRRLGDSVDWSRDRFTMDEGLSKAVTEVFVKLFEEGLIYRASDW